MRPANYRDKVKKMQNHVSCLQSRAKSLLREQGAMQLQVDVFEGLVCAREAWAAALKKLPGWEGGADDSLLLGEQAQASEHVLQQLPLLPSLSQIDRALHRSVLHLTADQTAKQWMAYIGDTTQLLVLHSLDPTVATPLLDAHMNRFGAWMVTLFFFNTKVAFELHNVNLVTRQKEAPPPGHWHDAVEAAGLTEQQRQQIITANQFCLPRLRQLQQEQQDLMEQLSQLQDGSGEVETAAAAAAAAAGQDGPGSPLLAALLGGLSQEAPHPQLPATSGADPPAMPASELLHASLTPSLLLSAAAAVQESPGDDGSGSNSSGGGPAIGSSNYERQRQMALVNELTHKIAANCRAWRVLTSMRGQYCMSVMTPLQFAKVLTASSPYMLFGAPMYDQVVASNPKTAAPKKRSQL